MSSPLRDHISGPIVIAGVVIGLGGVVWFLISAFGPGPGFPVLPLVPAVGGLALEVSGMAIHDRRHLGRAEAPHAMWGTGDARRPRWLGGPRI